MNLAFTKTVGNALFPADQSTAEAVSKAKLGTVWRGDFKKARNPRFLAKFMAMVELAFDHFEPVPIEHRGQTITPRKDFQEFRKWLVIRAGHYYVVGYPDGSVRLRAKSLSFANMDDDEFERVYSSVLDVILSDVVDMPKGEYEQMVDKIMGFA